MFSRIIRKEDWMVQTREFSFGECKSAWMHEKRGIATLKEGNISVFPTREEFREKLCSDCWSQKLPYW